MKRLQQTFALSLFLGGLLLSGVGTVHAQEVRVGVVDVRKVLLESKSGQRVKSELDKTAKQHQAKLEQEEKQIQALQQDFKKQELLLSNTQKQAKQKQIDEKKRAYSELLTSVRRELEKLEGEFMQSAIPDVRAIVTELASQQKLTLVLDKNQPGVIYNGGTDLTDQVLKRLDAKTGG